MGKTFVEWAVYVFTTVAVLTGLSGCATPTQPAPAGTEIDTATQVVVVIPSPTSEFTATPVATTTEVSSPTPIPEKYPIDMAKSKMPTSEAELEANPENFIEAPNPWKDIGSFKSWFRKYVEALGDLRKLTPNLETDYGIGDMTRGGIRSKHIGMDYKGYPILTRPNFFYFKNDKGDFFPSLTMTVFLKDYGYPFTNVVILDKGGYVYGNYGYETLTELVIGTKVTGIDIYEAASSEIPEVDNELINLGLNGSGIGEEVRIGPGVITIKK